MLTSWFYQPTDLRISSALRCDAARPAGDHGLIVQQAGLDIQVRNPPSRFFYDENTSRDRLSIFLFDYFWIEGKDQIGVLAQQFAALLHGKS